jgi:hypothetical protein
MERERISRISGSNAKPALQAAKMDEKDVDDYYSSHWGSGYHMN